LKILECLEGDVCKHLLVLNPQKGIMLMDVMPFRAASPNIFRQEQAGSMFRVNTYNAQREHNTQAQSCIA